MWRSEARPKAIRAAPKRGDHGGPDRLNGAVSQHWKSDGRQSCSAWRPRAGIETGRVLRNKIARVPG